jgi:peptide deformylase
VTISVRDQVERLVLAGTPVPIVQAGHPTLRAVAQPYEGQLGDELLDALVEMMRVTMKAAPGVGLAAPQIGIALAIVVAEDAGTVDSGTVDAKGDDARERTPVVFRALINPSYEPVGTERRSFYEGCLSVDGWQAVVSRYRTVRFRCVDVRGRAVDEVLTGWPARIIQHETDHCSGRLYLDGAELRSLSSVGNLVEYWAGEGTPVAAARALGFPLD